MPATIVVTDSQSAAFAKTVELERTSPAECPDHDGPSDRELSEHAMNVCSRGTVSNQTEGEAPFHLEIRQFDLRQIR